VLEGRDDIHPGHCYLHPGEWGAASPLGLWERFSEHLEHLEQDPWEHADADADDL
jgi:hypothetical protein